MRQLALNESTLPLELDPSLPFVPTGLSVLPGELYRFEAQGKWRDWFVKCGAAGWGGGWLTRFSRMSGQPFFRLCGVVGRDDKAAFAVDLEEPWSVPPEVARESDPQLYLFANDLRCMYWNNHVDPTDPLTVTITRLA